MSQGPDNNTALCFLQAGLSARGFTVRRLNTYNTVPVQSLPGQALDAARSAAVVAFASPSAVKAWIACVGGQDKANVAIACIGKSFKSYIACLGSQDKADVAIAFVGTPCLQVAWNAMCTRLTWPVPV
jgi:uroporphyrinogen-III synthase